MRKSATAHWEIPFFGTWLCLVLLCFSTMAGANTKNEILIGTHIPLSGVSRIVGEEQKWAYERAVQDINEKGGIYVKEYGKKLPVHLVIINDESNPGKAAASVERLIKRIKVDLILGGQVGALGVIPGMITAEKFKTYYHGTVIWVTNFVKHHFKYCTMYFFDIRDVAATPFIVLNTIPKDRRPGKPGLFVEDTFDGKILADEWERIANKYGFQIAVRLSLGMGAKDFSSQIMEAKAAGVDALFVHTNVPEMVTLVRQMKQNRFSVKFFQGLKGTWPQKFYEALGTDADYVLCDGFWSMDYPYPGARRLGEQYIAEHGKKSLGIGLYYATAQILWKAIELAGTLDDLKVRQAVLDNTFETVNGWVDYDDRGVAFFPMADFQWMNGTRSIVYPLDLAKSRVKLAPSWEDR